MSLTQLGKTEECGTYFWNDSCDLKELKEAVEAGAKGATSNPVIASAVVKANPESSSAAVKQLLRDHPTESEDEIAWRLIDQLGVEAAKLLRPIFDQSKGEHGRLSVQVNPKFHNNSHLMIQQGLQLARLAPNIAIKAPCTQAGLAAYEGLVAGGAAVNATVSFTVAQAVAAAEAIERGRKKRESAGIASDSSPKNSYVTLMVGRLDDHLQRIMARDKITIDPGFLNWAGVAVFKQAFKIFQERGYRAKLLVAAYRHHLHWSQLIGEGTIMTMPYAWWKQFNQSDVTVKKTIHEPVKPEIIETLHKKFPDFRKAFDDKGMTPNEFDHFGATTHTLDQFLNGYQELVSQIRKLML